MPDKPAGSRQIGQAKEKSLRGHFSTDGLQADLAATLAGHHDGLRADALEEIHEMRSPGIGLKLCPQAGQE